MIALRRYFDFWKNYFTFDGLLTVSDYWYGILFDILVQLILCISISIILLFSSNLGTDMVVLVAQIVLLVYNLLSFIPKLSATVRRLTDAGYSCKSFFWLLIPGIGQIAFISRLFGKSIR